MGNGFRTADGVGGMTVQPHTMTDDQADVIGFLGRPESYPGAPEVDRIDTHAAIVFLAGDLAYKLKRAVRYDYLDFSTLEMREAACKAEVTVNRRCAPTLYLGVDAIARTPDGSLAWGTSGRVLDWVVVMHRFEQEALLDRLAERGALDLSVMRALAEAVARFHESAERVEGHGGRVGMRWVVDGNARDFAKYEGTLGARACRAVTELCRDALVRHGDRLDARRHDGLVRRCHGDLHLRNIVMLDGRPTLFDGVEFNDEIACVDVLYDLAFLLMDLLRRDLPAHANAVFNRYLTARCDLAGLPLLPLFLGCRAAIRAKTSATAATLQSDASSAQTLRTQARDYLAMAERLLQSSRPMLVAIGGFSGSGKSTLAARLAPQIGRAPGALVLRSDVIRKALFGLPDEARLGPQGYSADANRQVYSAIVERAALALTGGHAVIADAVFRDPEERAAIAHVAADAGVPFAGLWLDAPLDTLAHRIEHRQVDVSDATATVLARQIASDIGPLEWVRVDAGSDPDETERRARSVLRTQQFMDASRTTG